MKNYSLFPSEKPEGTNRIYEKLSQAFGELSENIPLVLTRLPSDVQEALLAAEGDDAVKKIWGEYLAREVSYLRVPKKDEVDVFQAIHGHRYAKSVDAVLVQG